MGVKMLRKIGSFWKAKGDSKCKLSGTIDFLGDNIRVGIMINDKKDNAKAPDYSLVRFLDDEKPADNKATTADNPPPHNDDNCPF